MPTAAIDSFMSALLWKVGPVIIIAGIASLLLRELRQWLERSVTHAFRSRRISRRHSARILSSLNRQTEHIPDCPACDAPMVKRSVRRGPRAGQQFWGCANYPMCRNTKEKLKR
jgi:hypothetical protein